MNVLYITHYSGLYGANLSLLNLVDQLRNRRGIKVFVVVPSKGIFIDELKKRNIKFFSLLYFNWVCPISNDTNNPFFILKQRIKRIITSCVALAFSFYIRKYKIDVLHSNSITTSFGGYLNKYLKRPHIWHIREFMQEDYNIRFIFDSWAIRFINRHSTKIVCISDSIKNKYKDFFVSEKLTTIYNGIEIIKCNEEIKTNSKSLINLILIGVLDSAKGHLDALNAISILINEKKVDCNIRLNLVGEATPGNEGYRKMLEETVKMQGIKDNVIFHGYLKNVNELIRRSDIGLVCSKKEAFGRVTAEMMYNKIPIIGTKTGGTVELLQDTGLYYKPGDANMLAEQIKYLIDNNLIREELSIKAYNRLINNFSIEITAQRIYELYKSVCNKNIC